MISLRHTILKEIDLFKGLSDEDLERILCLCHEKTFQSGEIIFKEGQVPDRFYIILEGRVEVWKDYSTPYSDILAVKGEGASFGEMALIDDLPRSATIKTTGSTKVLYLEKEAFNKIIKENSSIAMVIMKSVSSMVRQSNESFIYGLRQKNQKLEAANEALKQAKEEGIKNERLSTLGKFSSLIIHDLKNPISVIKGYSEMIQLTSKDPSRVEMLSVKLMSEAERLNRMVGELLDYSRGDIRLNLGPVFLDQFLQKIQETQESTLANRKIELQCQCEFKEPVLLDQERVQRVLINLIDNSKKAMPREGGKITVTAGLENGFIIFKVADDGEGMPPEVQQRIFEPFFSSSRSGGTGLGMLVVSNVVEAHKGSISVESVLGQGTEITIKIPVNPETAS